MCSACSDEAEKSGGGERRPSQRERSQPSSTSPLSRRGFLGGLGGAAALGALAAASATSAAAEMGASGSPARFRAGSPLRIQPAVTYQFWRPAEKTSWRSYGDLQSEKEVAEEVLRIEGDLKKMAAAAEFPVEILPVLRVSGDAEARQAIQSDADVLFIDAVGGYGHGWMRELAAAPKPKVMFLRHKSGPYSLWHEIVHWRLLRLNGDEMQPVGIDVDDVVVDELDDVLWRMRALYGLKNARGTKMLAIGGMAAYSEPAQRLGPDHAREVWGYDFEIISEADFGVRLEKARSDAAAVQRAERETEEYLAAPGVKLATERKFVFNSFLAYSVCKQLMSECGASNFGFAYCMGRSCIEMLDTPPCLILSLANDEGYTAYCHTDLSHTLPGVLLRWIASRPTFVCNTHFPHHGIFSVAHCAAPRRMDGQRLEPAAIMTHFESDFGAAVKVDYPKGQVVTIVIPNLHCSKWQGLRGSIIDSPSHPACRSQIDIRIDGDGKALVRRMEGFHAQIVYGDYLREVGYALKHVSGVEWESFSESA